MVDAVDHIRPDAISVDPAVAKELEDGLDRPTNAMTSSEERTSAQREGQQAAASKRHCGLFVPNSKVQKGGRSNPL